MQKKAFNSKKLNSKAETSAAKKVGTKNKTLRKGASKKQKYISTSLGKNIDFNKLDFFFSKCGRAQKQNDLRGL